jgi:hypothetical protein
MSTLEENELVSIAQQITQELIENTLENTIVQSLENLTTKQNIKVLIDDSLNNKSNVLNPKTNSNRDNSPAFKRPPLPLTSKTTNYNPSLFRKMHKF